MLVIFGSPGRDQRARLVLEREQEVVRAQQEREQAERREAEALAREKRLREQALAELTPSVDRWLRDDFLAVDGWLSQHPLAGYLPHSWLERRKVAFVQDWARQTLDEHLDGEQALAVASLGNVRVTARAGSGKTRTLVTRAAFLVRHCRVPPDQVLLVAFNNAAAGELAARLRRGLPDGSPLPFTMTFHALAHALVHPAEELLHDSDQRPVQSDLVQTLINRVLSTR